MVSQDKNSSILIADTNEEILDVLQLVIGRMGYEVIKCSTAYGIFSEIQIETYPVIITSLEFSNLKGGELVDMINKQSPSTQIIILVDEHSPDTALKYLDKDKGVSDFLTKPVNSAALEIYIKRAFKRRERQQKIYTLERERDSFERSSLQFRQLFDEIPCYISIQDRNFRITGANKLFKKDFGDYIGSYCYNIYKHRDEPCQECPVYFTFQDGNHHQTEEVVTSKDGKPHNVLTWTSPLRDSDGNIYQVMEMSTDISLLRNLQSHLTSLGLMMGGMSHNIRGIMTGLEGGVYRLELGLRKDNKEQVHDALGTVKELTFRIKSMILSMLDYTKERQLSPTNVDAVKFARQVADIIALKAEKNNIELKIDFNESAGMIQIDPDSLNSCMVNILDNSIDACIDDRPRKERYQVGFSLRGNNDYIVFEIADNGVGMDQETREKMFTLFFSSKGNKGTGFGLFLSNHICEQHGGSIEVESEPGKGSVFRVSIPRIMSEENRTL
ncbi:ATP-binding protein [Thermodesulfobacteriota bacterium]